ncbi:MAG TPA: tetratricopeptide repeat protein [Methylomirabilota bacterium]
MLIALAAAPGLPAGYVFDDIPDIAANPAATPAGFVRALPMTTRPVLKASYAAVAGLVDGGAPAQRAVNVALHLAATLLVLLVLSRLVPPQASGAARLAPVLGAAAWAVHPVVVETVTYVSGRSMGLSTVFLLGAFVLATGSRSRRTAIGASVLAFLAPLARETALLLPALLALWQLTVAPRERPRSILRRHLPAWLGTLAAALTLALMPRHRDLVAFSLRARDPLEALLGNVHAISTMLSMWAFPWRISIDPAPPDVYAWTEFPTLWRLGTGVTSIVLVWVLRTRAPVAAFALGWTLLSLLPTNSIIWRVDPVGTRPLYLASVGLAIVLVGVTTQAARAGRRVSRAWVAAMLVLIAALAWGSASRAEFYRDPVALWADAAAKAPEKARPRANLGLAYLAVGNLDAAERALKLAIDLEPWDREARCALDAVHIRRTVTAMTEEASP